MSEVPYYECAAEKGFLDRPSEIEFAKLDYRVGMGQRVEQYDRFKYDGPVGKWMTPLNAAAVERAEAQKAEGRRKTVAGEAPGVIGVLPQPPRSGMRAIVDRDGFDPAASATPAPERVGPVDTSRPAPRRRAKP